ncbi:MAG: adenine phosphoribosyltransferase [Sphingopyxis sp.]
MQDDGDDIARIDRAIRVIADFPKPGIAFRDISPLMAEPAAFRAALRLLDARARAMAPDVIVAVEARGFLFGAPLADRLGVPLVPARKAGKLPGATISVDYALEYGHARLEMQHGALAPGAGALLVDDLLATGGTIAAAGALARQCGARVVGALFLIELDGLGGAARLAADDISWKAILRY